MEVIKEDWGNRTIYEEKMKEDDDGLFKINRELKVPILIYPLDTDSGDKERVGRF